MILRGLALISDPTEKTYNKQKGIIVEKPVFQGLKPYIFHVLSDDTEIQPETLMADLRHHVQDVVDIRVKIYRSLADVQRLFTATFNVGQRHVVLCDELSLEIIPPTMEQERSLAFLEMIQEITRRQPDYVISIVELKDTTDGVMETVSEYPPTYTCVMTPEKYRPHVPIGTRIPRYDWFKLVTDALEYVEHHREQLHAAKFKQLHPR